jgi:polysaccharide export outer membrane protein
LLSRRIALIGGCGLLAGCAATSLGEAPLAEVKRVEYRLGPGDQLRISVFGEPDLTGNFTVSPQGGIAFPLVGDVAVLGKTVPEATSELTKQLDPRYVRQAKVSIEVMNYRPFFILGEVETPGSYPYGADMTVMKAVATAGGFTYRADKRTVLIKHSDEETERAYVLTGSTPVQPGDTVRIPERRF